MSWYRNGGKRLLDLLVAVPLLCISAPVLAITWGLVRLALGAPALFRQVRPGQGGRLFVLRKFRTMSDTRDTQGTLLPDERRITRVGRLLRRASLDELLTLWDVIVGDMSLVGPRPLLVEYLPRYTPEQARRHEVKPGITGWAQVNGRNALTWEEKFRLDVWYVDHMSFWLDIKILWMTLLKVFRREGISASGYATMPEFMGSAAVRAKEESR